MKSSSQSRPGRFFIFQNDHLLLLKKNNALPSHTDHATITPHILRHLSLGCWDDTDYCCTEISPEAVISDHLDRLPLKQALSLLSHDLYGLAVKAHAIMHWDKNHPFCSRCGAVTARPTQAFERVCTACGLRFFPRISPAIIVLIKKEDQLLMARSPHFPPGAYSLIAGFVDPGESIEEAVHREVLEEVGLTIKNLSYWGSQPWPFPDSLMLAFTADYASGEIIMEQDEIEDAGWYPYDQLPGLPSSTLSISMKLIEDFICQTKRKTAC